MNLNLVVMGVAGCGKSSLAAAFARAERLRLRRVYRERLRAAAPGLRFAFLEIGREDALARVRARAGGHFFSAGLVDSQFATLEPPVGEPGVLRLDATQPLATLQRQLGGWWHAQAAADAGLATQPR